MNKLVLFGLLALIINSINATYYFEYCYDYDPKEVDSLRSINDGEIDGDICSIFKTEDDFTHCCYIKDSTNKTIDTHCVQIKDDHYENIKNFKKYVRDENNDGDFEIDCSSKFAAISLFVILSLLF